MTLPQSSNVVDVAARIPYGDPPVFALGDVLPGKVLEVIPVPETDQYMMIVAHHVSVAEAEAEAAVAETSRVPDGLGGPFLDRDARRVWVEGDEVALTFKEYEVLAYLTREARYGVHPRPPGERAVAGFDTRHAADRRRPRPPPQAQARRPWCLVTVCRVGYTYRPA